jgi:carboxypeptidase Q
VKRTAAILLSSILSLANASSPTGDSSRVALGRAIVADSKGYEYLTELTTRIGPRMSATPRGAAAEMFVYEKLRQAGLKNVHYESFPMLSWSRGTAELKVGSESIPSAALVYTPANAAVTAPMADVGNGTSMDYAADFDKVRGKVALIYMGILPDSPSDTPRLPRWEKIALALGHGAIGVVLINSSAGHHLVTGTAGGSPKLISLPVVVVSREDGLELRRKLLTGDRPIATLRIENTVAAGSARNVVARIEGSQYPNEVVVLGGHLDSLDLATGAVDDGTGAMWVLDVARGFAAHHYRPKRAVEFVFFMGEEEGLLGSYAFVRRAATDGSLSQVRYMINTDMSMNPNGIRLWGGEPDAAYFEALAADVRRLYPSFGSVSAEAPAMSQSSDSQPFIERGVPIAYPIAQWPDGLMACVHAECDLMKWVKPDDLRRSAGVGAMLLAALADAPSSVAHVLQPKEVDAYYKAQGIVPTYLGPVEEPH